jgi:hypothetical protein
MAHVGHTAARLNTFLDIPYFLRGLSQSLNGKVGPAMQIAPRILRDIQNVDPLDPTSVVEEYQSDWWTYEPDWQTHPPEIDDLQAAFEWHIQKVNENLYFVPVLTFILPIVSTVTISFQVV